MISHKKVENINLWRFKQRAFRCPLLSKNSSVKQVQNKIDVFSTSDGHYTSSYAHACTQAGTSLYDVVQYIKPYSSQHYSVCRVIFLQSGFSHASEIWLFYFILLFYFSEIFSAYNNCEKTNESISAKRRKPNEGVNRKFHLLNVTCALSMARHLQQEQVVENKHISFTKIRLWDS